MPSRRRSNLSRSTADARKQRRIRASESQIQREKRLRNQRLRTSQYRAAETDEQRRERREVNRRRRARYLASQREQLRAAERKRIAGLLGTDPDHSARGADPEDDGMTNSPGESSRSRRERDGCDPNEMNVASKDGKRKPGKRKARPGDSSVQRLAGGRSQSKNQHSGRDSEVFVKSAVRQWLEKVKRKVLVACSASCKDENVRVKMEPIEYVEVHSVSDGDEGADPASSVEIPSSSCGPASSLPQDRPSPESHCPAIIESEADPLHPDPSLKPVEVFLKIPEDQHTASRTASTNSIEMDPLCVDGRSEPLALITMSDEGVLREENYGTTSGGPAKVVIAMMIKEEEEVEDCELES